MRKEIDHVIVGGFICVVKYQHIMQCTVHVLLRLSVPLYMVSIQA